MMHSIRSGNAIYIAVAVIFCAASAFAQQSAVTVEKCPPCDSQPESFRHVLNGHAFLPSIFIPSEFVDTRATLAASAGYGSYEASLLGTSQEITLGALSPTLDVQFAFNEWLGMEAAFSANAVTGLNATSVIQYGGSTAYTWTLGAIGRLLETETTYLSLAMVIDRPHVLSVSPVESLIQRAQQSINQSAPAFPTNGVQTEYRPSLRLAHAFTSALGLRSLLGFDFQSGENLSERRTGNRLLIGLGLSLDLNPTTGVPIGLTANYRRGQILSGGANNVDIFEFGLFETVSSRFNIGGEIGFANSSGVSTTIGSLLARVYFN